MYHPQYEYRATDPPTWRSSPASQGQFLPQGRLSGQFYGVQSHGSPSPSLDVVPYRDQHYHRQSDNLAKALSSSSSSSTSSQHRQAAISARHGASFGPSSWSMTLPLRRHNSESSATPTPRHVPALLPIVLPPPPPGPPPDYRHAKLDARGSKSAPSERALTLPDRTQDDVGRRNQTFSLARAKIVTGQRQKQSSPTVSSREWRPYYSDNREVETHKSPSQRHLSAEWSQKQPAAPPPVINDSANDDVRRHTLSKRRTSASSTQKSLSTGMNASASSRNTTMLDDLMPTRPRTWRESSS